MGSSGLSEVTVGPGGEKGQKTSEQTQAVPRSLLSPTQQPQAGGWKRERSCFPFWPLLPASGSFWKQSQIPHNWTPGQLPRGKRSVPDGPQGLGGGLLAARPFLCAEPRGSLPLQLPSALLRQSWELQIGCLQACFSRGNHPSCQWQVRTKVAHCPLPHPLPPDAKSLEKRYRGSHISHCLSWNGIPFSCLSDPLPDFL